VLLAADANAILQAILGRASLAMETGRVELATTLATLNEVREHFSELAGKYHIAADSLNEGLALLGIKAYGRRKYRAKLAEAGRRMGQKDPDDVPLLALALTLKVPVWSNDRHFLGVGVQRYTTRELLAKLGIRRK
jgi:predicted nucleic acid-binding protein